MPLSWDTTKTSTPKHQTRCTLRVVENTSIHYSSMAGAFCNKHIQTIAREPTNRELAPLLPTCLLPWCQETHANHTSRYRQQARSIPISGADIYICMWMFFLNYFKGCCCFILWGKCTTHLWWKQMHCFPNLMVNFILLNGKRLWNKKIKRIFTQTSKSFKNTRTKCSRTKASMVAPPQHMIYKHACTSKQQKKGRINTKRLKRLERILHINSNYQKQCS